MLMKLTSAGTGSLTVSILTAVQELVKLLPRSHHRSRRCYSTPHRHRWQRPQGRLKTLNKINKQQSKSGESLV
jgi:hypothetical protein